MSLGFSDNSDKTVQLLQQIARNTASQKDGGDRLTYDIDGTAGPGEIDPAKYRIVETRDLDSSTYPVSPNGILTLNPGESAPMFRAFTSQSYRLLAVGAADRSGVEYELRINGQQTVGGRTTSPLGSINDPFSFANVLGATIPVQNVEYVAHYDKNATGSVDLTGRAHLEVDPK